VGVGYPLNVTCEVNVSPSLFVPLGAIDPVTVGDWVKLPVLQEALEPELNGPVPMAFIPLT
jgi:hypothetical protein